MMRLVLFGTSGCHLCEQAEQLIHNYLRADFELMIETIDIAEFEQWQEKYAIRIPVLYHPETQNELAWPFDQRNVEEFINRLSND
ncbi:Glutaredoxin [Candidatus Methylobacter favarea]|uniref:Glutaredoxin n=1 Tax=Candidatus Methylobacter favarea TaxID=2707345 RepID=A0A8S0WLD4_9GAMM|nr:glutaredoxin family protein [Candidatus Methylobacter favarea]CAA9892550.1 Glutaredoxin [Candidatus Methylobacter favarea]